MICNMMAEYSNGLGKALLRLQVVCQATKNRRFSAIKKKVQYQKATTTYPLLKEILHAMMEQGCVN